MKTVFMVIVMNIFFSVHPASIFAVGSPTTISGDLNYDAIVDQKDLDILEAHFGQTSCGNIADINEDCVVDVSDLSILAGNLGKSNPVPVPIMEGWWLFSGMLAGVGVFACRRKE